MYIKKIYRFFNSSFNYCAYTIEKINEFHLINNHKNFKRINYLKTVAK